MDIFKPPWTCSLYWQVWVNLTQIKVIWVEGTSMEELPSVDLSMLPCGHIYGGLSLLFDLGRPSPLCAVPPICRWAQGDKINLRKPVNRVPL